MLKAGLTGGYASGKSFVGAELARLGCHLIYADQLGHQVLLPGGAAYESALHTFGREILTVAGTIDRKRLASIVFSSPELLEKLNALVHPAVFRLEEQMLGDFASQDPGGVAIIEAAILIETGRYTHFDKLILAACGVETQIARGMKRDGLTRAEVMARLARQMPLEEKKRFADFVIDTGGTEQQTLAQVRRIFGKLVELKG